MYISSAIKSQIIFCFQADWTVLGSAANFVILLKFFGQHNEKKKEFLYILVMAFCFIAHDLKIVFANIIVEWFERYELYKG